MGNNCKFIRDFQSIGLSRWLACDKCDAKMD